MTSMYCLTVLEARSPNSGVGQVRLPLQPLGEVPQPPLLLLVDGSVLPNSASLCTWPPSLCSSVSQMSLSFLSWHQSLDLGRILHPGCFTTRSLASLPCRDLISKSGHSHTYQGLGSDISLWEGTLCDPLQWVTVINPGKVGGGVVSTGREMNFSLYILLNYSQLKEHFLLTFNNKFKLNIYTERMLPLPTPQKYAVLKYWCC